MVNNAKIDLNTTKELPTFAKYQLQLDENSSVAKVKDSARLTVTYKPCLLSSLKDNIDRNGDYTDIIAIPVEDLGGKHPRRLLLTDDTNKYVTWTLWGDDATNEDAIAKVMHRPVLIRNGLVKWFEGFDGEWQIRKDICAIRIDEAIDRMTSLRIFYEKNTNVIYERGRRYVV